MHVIAFTRVYEHYLIVWGDHMATISLADIDEVNLQQSFIREVFLIHPAGATTTAHFCPGA